MFDRLTFFFAESAQRRRYLANFVEKLVAKYLCNILYWNSQDLESIATLKRIRYISSHSSVSLYVSVYLSCVVGTLSFFERTSLWMLLDMTLSKFTLWPFRCNCTLLENVEFFEKLLQVFKCCRHCAGNASMIAISWNFSLDVSEELVIIWNPVNTAFSLGVRSPSVIIPFLNNSS